MLQSEKILNLVKDLEPKLIEERRRFHINAELSCREYETARYILSQMAALGLSPVWVREPVSAYFEFDTGKPGKALAFRADIDALPLQEDEYNLKQKKAAVSKNPGACHACGHDGHTAMLLSVARAIVQCKEDLCGKFIFFFEFIDDLCIMGITGDITCYDFVVFVGCFRVDYTVFDSIAHCLIGAMFYCNIWKYRF